MSQKLTPPESMFITNEMHGGKITCHKCNEFIGSQDYRTVYGVHFHNGCYNGYEHYYGLDKPID